MCMILKAHHKKDLDPLTLFSNVYHKEKEDYRGWLFVIDECQTLFPKNFKSEDVLRFFQLHRHYGIDVVLLSQDYKLVCPSISLLSEFQYRAVSDTANPLPGFFMYRQMVGWEQIGRKFKRKKQKVFDLYKTADFDQKKVKRKARPMLIIFIICAILGIIGILKVQSYKTGIKRGTIKNPERTFSEKKATSQNRIASETYQNYEIQYPDSYLEELKQKTLLPLDIIEDQTGIYYLLMGTLWPAKEFPYPTVKTRLGIQALVPLDLKQYEENKKTKQIEKNLPNPNNQITNSEEK